MIIQEQTASAVEMLKSMIAIPSHTMEEEAVADFLHTLLGERIERCDAEIKMERVANNILLRCDVEGANETLMLCAHIDTVPPSSGYTTPPHTPTVVDGRIIGLGSNDDGGSVVAMTEAFFHFVKSGGSRVNLLLALTAQEECSGPEGMELVLAHLRNKGTTIDMAIVGEPTEMKAAIAERGLLVIDGTAHGVSGHAARNEGENALYKALDDIAYLRSVSLPKVSPLMGEVKITVTQLNCGTQHNVIPDSATFVVDVRPTEQYSNLEILELLQQNVKSELRARNLKNRASVTPPNSKLMEAVKRCAIPTYISPTTSDWIRLSEIPAVKMGVGDSARSHRPDEYVKIEEIEEGIEKYIGFIKNIY